MDKVNLSEKLTKIAEHYDPKLVGEANGQQIRLAKLKGPFVWHQHEEEDEMFLVVKGTLNLEFRDKTVDVNEGEFIVVPRGVEHRPNPKEEVHVLMFVAASNINTGNVQNEITLDPNTLERI